MWEGAGVDLAQSRAQRADASPFPERKHSAQSPHANASALRRAKRRLANLPTRHQIVRLPVSAAAALLAAPGSTNQ